MGVMKWLLSIPFYGIGLFLGFLIELIKELKSSGLLDNVEPMDFKSGIRASKENSKEFFDEIKKDINQEKTADKL